MAMTEISLRQPLRYTIDLSAGLVQQPMRSQLMKGDKKANRVIVHLTDGGKDVTLSGVTVTGSFIRPPDAAEIPLTGETSGSEAIVTLDDACYSTEGYCEISVKLTVGETSRTILTLTGYVLSKGSGAYVDVSGVIPNLDDVIEQYAKMKRVTQETQAAGTAAGNAASAANTAADEANRQAQAAQQAAQAANTAASKIDGLTVSAEKANEAGVTISQKDGAYHVNFKLPKGDTGATPDITFEVETGPAGSAVKVEQSGTPEAPVVKLTIPRGDTGSVDGIDYYEGNPAALGTASPGTANGVARGNHVHPMPSAADVGALGKDEQAADSKKLGGQLPEYYAKQETVIQISEQKVDKTGWTAGKNVVTDDNGNIMTEDKPKSIPSGGTTGQVLTKISDTDQDTEWRDPSGGMEMKLVWSNPSPSSSFREQTLEIDLSAYTHVLISFRRNSSTARYMSIICKVGQQSSLNDSFNRSSGGAMISMRTFEVTETGIVFDKGLTQIAISEERNENNSYLIPANIYGIKGATV